MSSPIEQLVTAIDQAGLWEETCTYKRNAYLSVQGSTDSRLYYVVDGCVRIFVVDTDEEHTIRFGYQNNFITALDTFITGAPSENYIQALRKTTVKTLSKSSYTRFIQSSDDLQNLWQELLEMLVYQQIERERDLLTASPRERYNRVLKRSPQLFQEVPHKYIAAYLRMTPETLSRLKND